MTSGEIIKLLQRAYLAGFNAAGEGWNGEYPFGAKGTKPTSDKDWRAARNSALKKLMKGK